jgi:hypothetical protein
MDIIIFAISSASSSANTMQWSSFTEHIWCTINFVRPRSFRFALVHLMSHFT